MRNGVNVDLYEYQARDLFEQYGVPVLRARTATGPYAAGAAAEALASPVVVVKAQVKTGGRGKAGGVKLARDPQEAIDRARDILGMDIKGHRVRLDQKVLKAYKAQKVTKGYKEFKGSKDLKETKENLVFKVLRGIRAIKVYKEFRENKDSKARKVFKVSKDC